MAAAQRPIDNGTSSNASGAPGTSRLSSSRIDAQQPFEGPVGRLDLDLDLDGDASVVPQPIDASREEQQTMARHDHSCSVPDCTPAQCHHEAQNPSDRAPAEQMTLASSLHRPQQHSSTAPSTAPSAVPSTVPAASTTSTADVYPSTSDFLAVLHDTKPAQPASKTTPRPNQQVYFAVPASNPDRSSSREFFGGEVGPREGTTARNHFDGAGRPGRPAAPVAQPSGASSERAPIPIPKQPGSVARSHATHSSTDDTDTDSHSALASLSKRRLSNRRESGDKSDGSADTAVAAEDCEDSGEEKISALFVPHQSVEVDADTPPLGSTPSAALAATSSVGASARQPPREAFSSWRGGSVATEPEAARQTPVSSSDLSPNFGNKIRQQISHSDQQYAARIASVPVTPNEEPETVVSDSAETAVDLPSRPISQYFEEPDQEIEPAPNQPRDAIELIPYKHQVGGHTTLWRFSKRAVCKQLTNRENEFYEKIERYHRDLLPFLPRYVFFCVLLQPTVYFFIPPRDPY